MIGDDFSEKFKDYVRHVADSILLDTDSRKVVQYLGALKEMINDLRLSAGLEELR